MDQREIGGTGTRQFSNGPHLDYEPGLAYYQMPV
jgi:hypothetical protein